jgi:hypothetical protein
MFVEDAWLPSLLVGVGGLSVGVHLWVSIPWLMVLDLFIFMSVAETFLFIKFCRFSLI